MQRLHRTEVLGLAALVALAFCVRTVWATDIHEGRVVRVTKDTLTMTDKQGRNEQTLAVDAEAKITLDSKPAKLEELKQGDTVTATTEVKNNKTVATKVVAMSIK